MLSPNLANKLAIAAIVIISTAHLGVYIAMFTCMYMAIVHLPWWQATFYVVCSFSPALSGFFCMFTNVENYFRLKLGWPQILDDTTSHYLRKIFKKGTIIPFAMKNPKE